MPWMTQLPLHNATALAVGWNQSCVVTSGSEVKCWGLSLGLKGELLGDPAAAIRPVAVDTKGLDAPF